MISRLILLAALVVVPAAAAENPPKPSDDPAVACKENPADPRCVGYLGATSGSDTRLSNGLQSNDTRRDNGRYGIFVHTGGGDPALADRLTKALSAKGFIVRGVDNKIDAVGGPGIDYFNDQDRQGARDVADIVNQLLDKRRIVPRFQRVVNPQGFLGVWLYGAPAPNDIDPKTWSTRVPAAGWCYQQNRQKPGPGNWLVHCHYSKERCETVRGDKSEQKTECAFINLTDADWQPSPGGFYDAWFQFSPTPFRPPFPQFNESAIR